MNIDRYYNGPINKCVGPPFFSLANPVVWQLDTHLKDVGALCHFLMAKYYPSKSLISVKIIAFLTQLYSIQSHIQLSPSLMSDYFIWYINIPEGVIPKRSIKFSLGQRKRCIQLKYVDICHAAICCYIKQSGKRLITGFALWLWKRMLGQQHISRVK